MGGDSEGSNEREREERESPSSHPEERGRGWEGRNNSRQRRYPELNISLQKYLQCPNLVGCNFL